MLARSVFLALLCALGCLSPCQAGQFRYCDPPTELDATQQDTLLRFGAVIKSTLESTGQRLALVARSGLDLSRFDIVGYIDDLIYAPELRYLDEVQPGLAPHVASSSIRAQREIIAAFDA